MDYQGTILEVRKAIYTLWYLRNFQYYIGDTKLAEQKEADTNKKKAKKEN
jgi:hypothetical protein